MATIPPEGTLVRIEVDRSSSTPLYLQLASGIEEAIRGGDLPAGSRLENELALAKRLGLSRPTVRQGIQELVDKGMLVRKRGVGTQVVQAPVSRQVALTSLYDDLRTAGKEPRTEVVEYRIGRPSAEAVSRLQLGAGEQVLDLIRVRYADGEPLAVLRNTIPERIAPSREALAASGLYACLRDIGVATVLAHERIGATVADEELSELLEEQVGAPLLTMERKSFANDGTVVEYGNHVYRASRYSFEVTLVDS
ncbi:GntR family transcriptional regulator [Brachybacterium saurashtrense]|uniref:GntR family transcriptional regulator n=1 Tax=Brachybacterium saurashtrense TaxID=556288 RepID=A0A345YS15_9MICO|nr:GntR family transcriptional regulator [Brachybacterium saurashtrense]AXK46717.1 GntR family transcriptional regulator [Brachybacterium saurashtrense]RRR22432.1 GntR family transcriptional regulator [Brachybacterium saurashtrense]